MRATGAARDDRLPAALPAVPGVIGVNRRRWGVDERTIARAQARMIRTALTDAGFGVHDLWLEYYRVGGKVGELEVDAYLHHALYLAPRHRDGLVRAAKHLVPHARLPYSRDLRPDEHPPDL
jgi:hypothetical protein